MGQSATFIQKGKIFVGKEICAKSEKYRQSSFHAPEVYRSTKVEEVVSTPVSTPKEGKWSVSRCICFSSEKLPDLWNSYVTDGPAQVQFCAGQNAVYTYCQLYMCFEYSPVEIRTPTHRKPIGRGMTAPPPMLSSSSIRPTISSHCHVILARKNPARSLKKCHFNFSLFKKFFATKLHKFKVHKLRIYLSFHFGYPDEVGDSLLYRKMLT